jgi:hypothetical protein
MKKLSIIFLSTLIAILFPLTCYAEWVDADRSGQEGVLVYGVSGNTEMNSEIALDSQGRPHIVFVEYVGTGELSESYICYLYWNGTEWVDADGSGQESVHVYYSLNAKQISFALNSLDQPGIAFSDGANLNYLYYNGSAWVDADGSGQESITVYSTGMGNQSPSLRFTSLNRPVIAWRNVVFLSNTSIYYLQWNGSAWVDADGTGQGEISVYGPNNQNRNYPSLRIDSSNNPHIAWQDPELGNYEIYYLKWNGSAWVDADGTGRGEIDIYTDTGSSTYPSLSLDSDQNPAIAWRDDTLGAFDIYYFFWNGSAWVDADGTGQESIDIYTDAGTSCIPSLALNSDNNNPAITWFDNTTGGPTIYEIYYLYFDGSAWVDADGSGQEGIAIYPNTGTQNSTTRALALDSSNNYPRITWYDYSSGDGDIYYLEWYVESPSPSPSPISPSPIPTTLPETGMDFVDYVNVVDFSIYIELHEKSINNLSFNYC